MYESEEQICRDALVVQDACNLVGVLRAFHEAALWLHRDLKSTDVVSRHPAMRLFADKVASLTGMQGNSFEEYCTASDYCRRVGKVDSEAPHSPATA